VGIEQEIADWAATRPAWQQSVLLQLARGHAFDQSEVAAFAAALIAGKQPPGAALSAADVPGAQPAAATVSLRSICHATNVNALLDGQDLTFGDSGLTVESTALTGSSFTYRYPFWLIGSPSVPAFGSSCVHRVLVGS
jgi:hypothetical protein